MKMTLNMMTASNGKTTQMWKRTQIWRQPQWEQTKPVLPNQFYQTKHTKLNKIYQTKPSKATKEKQYTSINQVNLANSEPVIWILSKPNKFLALSLAQLSLSLLSINIKASHAISRGLAGGCLGSLLGCINWISQLCVLHNQNLTWNGWDMKKVSKLSTAFLGN